MTRRSRRELERALDDLDSGAPDPPGAGLVTLLSTAYNGGAVRLLDPERRLVRVDGELRRVTEHAFEKLTWEPPLDDAGGTPAHNTSTNGN